MNRRSNVSQGTSGQRRKWSGENLLFLFWVSLTALVVIGIAFAFRTPEPSDTPKVGVSTAPAPASVKPLRFNWIGGLLLPPQLALFSTDPDQCIPLNDTGFLSSEEGSVAFHLIPGKWKDGQCSVPVTVENVKAGSIYTFEVGFSKSAQYTEAELHQIGTVKLS